MRSIAYSHGEIQPEGVSCLGRLSRSRGLFESLLSLVAQSPASFLPEWDEIEQHVNSARGGAGEVVADLRHRVEAARSTLLRSLGEGYLAHANAERAVNALEQALELSPDDEAAARSLVAACLRSGRLTRADELRKEFSLV